MKAFTVAWRTFVSFYNELFFLIGMSLLWWITGGVFVGLACALGWATFISVGPWSTGLLRLWLAPVVAIPAGPAIMALAAVSRRSARDRRVDRSDYFEAFKAHWKQGLALNAIGMVVLALLLLNLVFYLNQPNPVLRMLSMMWVYLILFWLSIQFYVYPFFMALEKPVVLGSLRMAGVSAFANPLFSILLLVCAGAVTAVSLMLAVPILIAWPVLMALLGEHSLRLFLQRAGVKENADESS